MSDADQTWPSICHRCASELSVGEGSFYVVKIEAFADPTPPAVDEHTPTAAIAGELDDLIAVLSEMSEQELMDQVHRRLTLLLCGRCYRHWIEHPTG